MVQNSELMREKIITDMETTIMTKKQLEGEKKIRKLKVGLPKIKTKYNLPLRLKKVKSVNKELSLDNPKVRPPT